MSKPRILKEMSRYTVVYKPAGMPTQPDQTGDMSLLDWLSSKTGRGYYLCHRIDRPVSGCVVMAHSAHAQLTFAKSKTVKHYIAIVEKKGDIEPSGSILGYLYHDKRRRKSIYSSDEKEGYKKARLDYRLLSSTDRYHILDTELLTGKYHQIRSLLAQALHAPIKGDVKYGARRANKDRSIHLHCHRIVDDRLGIDITVPRQENDALWQIAMSHLEQS